MILDGLSKTFGDQRALDGVSLALYPGQVHALIGENGSGKSTLIKCLTGVYQPDGRDQIAWGIGDGRSAAVVVHQDLGLVPGLTVAENFGITTGFERGFAGRIAWRRHTTRVRAQLAQYGVHVDAGALVEQLSMAQRTLVTIARALSESEGRARLLILDEPTASLPLSDRHQVVDTARQLANGGMAVVYVSHHLDEIVELADVVTVLRDGRLEHSVENTDLNEADLLVLMSGVQSNHIAEPRSTDGDVRLEFKAVSTSVLRNVSFTVRAGEVVGLVGAPDSGTSHVCRSAAGLLDRTGSITVSGDEVSSSNRLIAKVDKRLLLVPGDRRREGIVAGLTVRDNIDLTWLLGKRLFAPLSGKKQRQRTLAVMEQLDVRPREPERNVSLLSGGNQQKVVIGRCLAASPDVLVLENPTQGVDPAARSAIRALLRRSAENGLAVLLTDVDEAEVAAVADRLLFLHDGTLTDHDPMAGAHAAITSPTPEEART